MWSIFATVALVAYLVDLASKELALRHLDERDIHLVGDLLVLRLAFNPGAAFSLGTDATIVFTVLASIATVVVLVLSRRLGSAFWAVALGVLLAGITGNLTDRIFRDPEPFHGHVVDMIALPNWPIFNVADMCINVAAALIVIQAFRGIRLDGSRIADDEQTQAEGETPVGGSGGSDTTPEGPAPRGAAGEA